VGVPSMNDVEAVAASLSFDDLLQAVSESSRGRWFLEEFQKRQRKTESGDILSAINRIEARIAELPGPVVASTEMTRMKAAVNAARADIAKLAPSKTLSDEGRLFASLAELARKTLAADVAPGIVKALQLVDELDTTLNGGAKGEHYFKQDQAVFEPVAPAPKPVLVASTPEPVAPSHKPMEAKKPDVEVPPQGAKLVIIKSGVKVEEPSVAAIAEPVIVAEPAKLEPVEQRTEPVAITDTKKPDVTLPVDKIDNPRIVIIRRKPEDMTEVPLADEVRAETAA
jgi:hypothetical protein